MTAPLCLGVVLIIATLQTYSQEILARCSNGYHKSPSGDYEKYVPHKELQDAIMDITEVHLDFVKKSVGRTAPPKSVQVAIVGMEILVSARKSTMIEL